MTILIADDDRVLVQILSVRLKKAGYRVVAVYDAMQAILVALRNPPDAILLDVNMPGGTGRQVLRQLKNSARPSRICKGATGRRTRRSSAACWPVSGGRGATSC